MKLQVLQTKFKKKYIIRAAAGVLTIALLGSSMDVYHVYAKKNNKSTVKQQEMQDKKEAEIALADLLQSDAKAEAREILKDETVYIIADPVGKAEKTIVSEWLKNPEGKDALEDVSELQDIQNVKGDEAFEKNGSSLSWQASGNDIYYQGTTEKQAPVTEKVTYYLDGEEIEPDALAGKDGKVTIRFDYTNHETRGDVCVPFVAVSGMLLDDSFRNIEVTNGKVVSNGDKNIVMGVAMPGLRESLQADGDFSEDVSIPDYVEVTADVENFALDMTMTVVTGGSEFMLDSSLDLSDMDRQMDELADAMEQLKDGSGELSDGLDTLDEKMDTFSDGVNHLQNGILAYTNGAKTLADGIGTLKGQSAALISGVADLSASVATLNHGIQTLDQSLNQAMGDKERTSAAKAAKRAAEQAVDAQFADDSNPQGYTAMKAQAEAQFAGSLTADANLALVRQQAADAVSAQTEQIAGQAKAIAAAQVQNDPAIQAQLGQLKEAVAAAGQMQYVQSDPGKAAIAAAVTGMTQQLAAAGFSEEQLAALQDILTAAATTTVMTGDGNAQAAGAEAAKAAIAGISDAIAGGAGQAAAATAKEVAPQSAEAAVRGVAEQAKGSIGTSMAESVKTAAKTAAGQAAAEAAVEGAEAAKKLIAQSIEKQDAKSGHSLVTGMAALNEGVSGLYGRMPQLTDGIEQLYAGSQTLASKNEELNSGAAKLADGNHQLTDGVRKLADGSMELSDGIVEFDDKGIEKLLDAYHGDIKDFTNRLQAVKDAGNTYDSFGGKADHMEGSVKFIIKTEGIKAEEK